MNSNRRILAVAMALVLIVAGMTTSVFAGATGNATIGFSSGPIYYLPYGISNVEGNLNLDFGEHSIDSSTPIQTYRSVNSAGYAIANESGGSRGYRVTLGLSSFDNGLEGATFTLLPLGGVVSDDPYAQDRPILIGGLPSIELDADGFSTEVILQATNNTDPNHTALGRWGFNFQGDLKVYSNTVRAGRSKSVMTWTIENV